MSLPLTRPVVFVPLVALGLVGLYLHYWGKKLGSS
jgi:hypothetical protein